MLTCCKTHCFLSTVTLMMSKQCSWLLLKKLFKASYSAVKKYLHEEKKHIQWKKMNTLNSNVCFLSAKTCNRWERRLLQEFKGNVCLHLITKLRIFTFIESVNKVVYDSFLHKNRRYTSSYWNLFARWACVKT